MMLEFLAENNELVANLLEAVFLFVVSLLAFGGRKLAIALQDQAVATVGREGYLLAKETALTIVRALAQSPAFEGLANERKKELALIGLREELGEKGILMSYDQLDKLVEAAVDIIKREGAKVPAVEE